MRLRAHIAFLLTASWLLPGIAKAWAGPGHQLIARLAEDHLEHRVHERLVALLGTPDLAAVSTWADDLMRTPECDHTEPWHFINIEDGSDLESSERSPRGDLMRALEHFDAMLRDPHGGEQERAWAARYLIHLVGDIHQPLHVGRRADRGGNDIAVQFLGKPTNLHLVWDFHLIDQAVVTYGDLARWVKNQPREVIAAWQRSSYRGWLDESLHYRQAAYDTGGSTLDRVYAERHQPLIELRLAQAGIRLAALFNELLDRPPSEQRGRPSQSPTSDTPSPCAGLR